MITALGTIPRQVVALSVVMSLSAVLGTGVRAQEAAVAAHDAWMRQPAPSKDDWADFGVINTPRTIRIDGRER